MRLGFRVSGFVFRDDNADGVHDVDEDDDGDDVDVDVDVDDMGGNEGVNFRHPSAQIDDTENLTKHWPCPVKRHFPGQHIRPGRICICISKYENMFPYVNICMYLCKYLVA